MHRTLLALALAAATLPAHAAGGIAGVSIQPNPAKAGAEVKLTITADEDASKFCGLRIEFGDGDGKDIKIASDEGLFPRTIVHKYAKPGTYQVKVEGKKVTTHLPCNGKSGATLVVEDAHPAKAEPARPAAGPGVAAAATAAAAGPAEPACPAGWALQAKSWDRKSGAFACEPRKPEAKVACGPGLVYYEKGNLIGCRKVAGKK